MALVSLQVVFPENDPANGSTLFFGVSNTQGNSKIVSGVRAVEQHFIKLMLTQLGTDQFNFDAGTALEQIGRQQIDKDNMLSVRNDIALAIGTVEQHIVNSQSGVVLAPEEILISARPTTINYVDGAGWEITVQLTLGDGNVNQVFLQA